jgi:hypothetical protein
MIGDARRLASIAIAASLRLAAGLLVLGAVSASGAEVSSADDTARFLAGMPPSAASPLQALSRYQTWQRHAEFFNSVFADFDTGHLAKIRAWSSATLTTPQPVMFYMFSGPDFLHADAFFPNASTYVLAGLEPVGQVPELTSVPTGTVMQSLGDIEAALRSVLTIGFFRTHDMRTDQLSTGRINGTLPILYVFLARSGKAIQEVNRINLDDQGAVRPDGGTAVKTAAHGVQIIFSGADGRKQTLYYFSTNLADDGVRNSGFLKFGEQLGVGDSFVKSASYLMHGRHFAIVRSFLLDHSAAILQDDSGIPLSFFDRAKWKLRPFGRYVGPIDIFPGTYQAKMSQLFRKGEPPTIDFGIGYRWRPNESNLLLAERSLDTK